MPARRAPVATALLALLLAPSCTLHEVPREPEIRPGDGSVPLDAHAPDVPAGPGDGAGTGGEAGAAGGGGLGGPPGLAGAGGAGDEVPPLSLDAAVMEVTPPGCPAGTRSCEGQCIAAAACCQDSDCPMMTTGQIGKCDRAAGTCQYMCAADQKPCDGACIPAGGCCGEGSCTGNFACVLTACSTTQCRTDYKLCGADCIPAASCCRATGCCGHSDCGPCQKCASGTCVNQGETEDLKNECTAGACRTGRCDGQGACGNSPDGQNGPSCTGECVRCAAGACTPHAGICSTGQQCAEGKCPQRPPVAVRIKVNGPVDGLFAADPGPGGICGTSTPYRVDRPINGTLDDALYQSEVFGAPLICAVGAGTLPAGPYQVVLHFAEIYWGPTCPGGGAGVGARVFDIELEGQVVATNVDIFAEAGCAASSDGSGRPAVKRFMTTINDGTLDLKLDAHTNNGKISAIEILSAW